MLSLLSVVHHARIAHPADGAIWGYVLLAGSFALALNILVIYLWRTTRWTRRMAEAQWGPCDGQRIALPRVRPVPREVWLSTGAQPAERYLLQLSAQPGGALHYVHKRATR